jgi:parallel beta-helix repeat protein
VVEKGEAFMKRTSVLMLVLILLGSLSMALNVKQAKSDYVLTEAIYVHADGSITPPGAPVTTADNVTYTLTDNIVDAAPTYNRGVIVLQKSNTVLDGAGYTLQVAKSNYGIRSGGSNITVKNVKITAFMCGIHLTYASNCTVSHSSLTNGVVGIVLSYSSNNTISNNNVAANGLAGVGISTSSNSNSVTGNIVASNDWGIMIEGGASDNVVSGNSVSGNHYGLSIKGDSECNIAYHNGFVDNTDSASAYLANVWDDGYPSGGNYWSDYTGVDVYSGPYQNMTGSDGIGDTEYVIDANNSDRYPLMLPPGPLKGDVNGDGKVNILDAILLANAFNSRPGDVNWNPNADFNGDEKVNILDAIILSSNFGKS